MILPSYELGIDRQKGMLMSAQLYLNVSQLRELLLGMERDLGLGKLTQNERCLLSSAIGHRGKRRPCALKRYQKSRTDTQYHTANISQKFEKLGFTRVAVKRAKYQGGIVHFTRRGSRPNACGTFRYCLRRQTNLNRGYTI